MDPNVQTDPGIQTNPIPQATIVKLLSICYSGFFKYEVRSTWGHSLKQGA